MLFDPSDELVIICISKVEKICCLKTQQNDGLTGSFQTLVSITPWRCSIMCCSFALVLSVALYWPRFRNVRRWEQHFSVCLPGWADTVTAAQTADSCIFLASSVCYLETSDFITADQCSCTLWLSPGLSALSVCQSFSWAVSNWVLADILIFHCASVLSFSTFPSILTFIFHLLALLTFTSIHILTYYSLFCYCTSFSLNLSSSSFPCMCM